MNEQTQPEHVHKFVPFHADYCHKYETGTMCECGKRLQSETRLRDFSSANSAWWHWGRAGCPPCEALMQQAGLDPNALSDEDLACREIARQHGHGEDTQEPSFAALPPSERGGAVVLSGRTGMGLNIEVRDVGAWLDFRYLDSEGVQRGFSLNPRYAGELFRGLAAVMVNRAGKARL